MARERAPQTATAKPEAAEPKSGHASARPAEADLESAPHVQGFAGNQAIGRALAASGIRPKLAVSQPGDPDEEEADRVADAVVRRSSLHAKHDTPAQAAAPQAVNGALAAVNGGGLPLSKPSRSAFESAFGRDLSRVRVHTDSASGQAAQAIGARAYTVGAHIAFAPGEYRPEEPEGQRLLAHELTHVAQHSGDRIRRAPDEPPAAPADTADKIKRIVATAADKEIVKLTTSDSELNVSTPAQRAGMVRILTDLTWTNEEEERATVKLIKHGGQAAEVVILLDAIGYRQKVRDSVDNDALHAELDTLLAAVPQGGPSADPAIANALSTQSPKDVMAITDFSKATTLQRVGLLRVLLAMLSSNDVEESKMLDIVESDVSGVVFQLKSLGLKQSLFDHIDSEATKQRLTKMLGSLKDPEIDKDLEVFNRSYLGNVWEGLKGGVQSAVENFSLGNIIKGILKPIIHPIDTIVDLFDQAADFFKNPSLGRLLAFLRDFCGTVAMWLLVLTGIVWLVDAALAAGIITIPAAIPVAAIGAFLTTWTGYFGIAFLVFAGLKFLLDLHEAGAATTQPELETKQKEIGDDLTLAAILALFAGLVRVIKITLVRFKGGAVDPDAAKPDKLSDTAKDGEKNQETASKNLEDMKNKGDAAGKGAKDPMQPADRKVDPSQPKPPDSAPAGMSDALKKLRGSLSDKAQRQFDKMFQRMEGNSTRMQEAIDKISKAGDLDKRLSDQFDKDTKVGTPFGETVGDLPDLRTRAEKLLQAIEDFRKAYPGLAGKFELGKLVKGELARLERMLKGEVEATKEGVEGTRNNLDGAQAELDGLESATGLTGVNQTFPLDGVSDQVEVDRVVDDGKTWVDEKNVKPFGLESNNWTGKEGKQGLKVQVEEMVRSAQQNPVNGTPPKVVIQFPQGVSPEVADAVRKLGAEPRGDVMKPDVPPILPTVPQKDSDRK